MRTSEVPQVVSGWAVFRLTVLAVLKAVLLSIVLIPIALWWDAKRAREMPYVKCPFCPRTARALARVFLWISNGYIIDCVGCGKTYKATLQILVADKDGNVVAGE